MPIPQRFVREMVADWYGAGMAQGKTDIHAWYALNRDHMLLHPATRALVEHLLKTL